VKDFPVLASMIGTESHKGAVSIVAALVGIVLADETGAHALTSSIIPIIPNKNRKFFMINLQSGSHAIRVGQTVLLEKLLFGAGRDETLPASETFRDRCS